MKTPVVLLAGAALLLAGYFLWESRQSPTLSRRTAQVAETTRERAVELKDKVVEESRTVGARADDARIVAAIKGKYFLDRDLSALAISVSCRGGRVQLTGSAGSEALIGRAVRLARETHGVTDVTPLLAVK